MIFKKKNQSDRKKKFLFIIKSGYWAQKVIYHSNQSTLRRSTLHKK